LIFYTFSTDFSDDFGFSGETSTNGISPPKWDNGFGFFSTTTDGVISR